MTDVTEKSPMVPGAEVEFGGRKMVLPPLNVRLLRAGYDAKLDAVAQQGRSMTGAPSAEFVDPLADCVLAALQRNYDGVTMEFVAEFMDLGNIGQLLRALMGVNAYVPGEAGAAG